MISIPLSRGQEAPVRSHSKRARLIALAASVAFLSGCGTSLTSEQKSAPTSLTLSEGKPDVISQPGATAAGPKPAAVPPTAAPSEMPRRSVAATKAAEALTEMSAPGSTAYKIGALDVLEVSVFKVPELSKSVQVTDNGTVNLALVGDVPAAGRTAQDLERELVARLGAKYLQNPQVTVYIREYNSQRITLEGAIKKPGVYPIRGNSTLLQFIAIAEGLDPNSDSTVVVFRMANGKRSAAKFNVSDIRSGEAVDPTLRAGDVVVAPTSAMKETFNTIMKALPLASVFALL